MSISLPPREGIFEKLMSRLPSDTVLAVYKLRKYFPLRRGLTEIFKGLPPRYVRAVDDITFFIREGETFCLVGESGCGKTTTGRAILRLIEPTSGYIFYRPKEELLKELTSQIPNLFVRKGFIDVAQIPIRFLKPLRKELQVIFQDPYGSLNPRFKIRAILEEPLLVHGLGETHEERTNIVRKALEDVRLIPPEEFMDRYPHMLSGGQRQRIGIARAIILEPRFIVADEPVSMLDVSIRAEILELMMELKKKYSLTYLFITHDLAVARYICDRIAVMYLGVIVEMAPTDELVENPLHPYTKALIAAVPEPEPSNRHKFKELLIKGEVPSAAAIPPGCRFHPRCVAFDEKRNELSNLCPVEQPELVEIEPGHYVACWLYSKR